MGATCSLHCRDQGQKRTQAYEDVRAAARKQRLERMVENAVKAIAKNKIMKRPGGDKERDVDES